jgi:predicted nucleotidyltransferase
MIQLEPRHLKMITDILAPYPYTFYVFGSRAKGTARKLSDLDLCYFDSIPLLVLAEIQEKCVESNLPFTVDFINWHRCKQPFQELIKNDLIKLPTRLSDSEN